MIINYTNLGRVSSRL